MSYSWQEFSSRQQVFIRKWQFIKFSRLWTIRAVSTELLKKKKQILFRTCLIPPWFFELHSCQGLTHPQLHRAANISDYLFSMAEKPEWPRTNNAYRSLQHRTEPGILEDSLAHQGHKGSHAQGTRSLDTLRKTWIIQNEIPGLEEVYKNTKP